jgi:hypothetical protein
MARKQRKKAMSPAVQLVEAVTVSEVAAPSDEALIRGGIDHDAIAALAYEYWLERGSPMGSPEEDWFRAEESIRRRQLSARPVTAA